MGGRRAPLGGVVMLCAVLCALSCGDSDDVLSPSKATFRSELAVRDAAGEDRTVFAPGEIVDLVLTVRNVSAAPVILEFPDAFDHDFVISTDPGPIMWMWSSDRAFIQVRTEMPFESGEVREFPARWNQVADDGKPAARGKYAVDAYLLSEAAGTSAPTARFEIR